MGEEQKLKLIDTSSLLDKVAQFHEQGYRLVQIGCTRLKYFELNYSFDRNLDFINLRMNVIPGYEIHSITSIYWNAFLYENEIHDLFGIDFKHIAVDYKGNFYKTAVKTPFAAQKPQE